MFHSGKHAAAAREKANGKVRRKEAQSRLHADETQDGGNKKKWVCLYEKVLDAHAQLHIATGQTEIGLGIHFAYNQG